MTTDIKRHEELAQLLDAIVQSYDGPEEINNLDSAALPNERKVIEAYELFGTPAGIHTGSPAFANQMIEKGFQFVAIQNETAYMVSEAKRVLSEVGRTGAPAPSRPAGPYG